MRVHFACKRSRRWLGQQQKLGVAMMVQQRRLGIAMMCRITILDAVPGGAAHGLNEKYPGAAPPDDATPYYTDQTNEQHPAPTNSVNSA